MFKQNECKISQHIKLHFDNKYGPNWHCIVGIFQIFLSSGKHFNSFCSYESKHYIFFYEGQMAILLYKMG
jgi:dynein light chain LC8-type